MLVLAIFDVDDFKQVNEEFGHAVGDSVLRTVGSAIIESLRQGDLVARLGGDEFVLLLSCCDAVEAMEAARRIVSALNRTDPLGMVTASAGVATVDCAGAPPELGRTLLQDADRALLEAKRRGKCRALHFTDLAPCKA